MTRLEETAGRLIATSPIARLLHGPAVLGKIDGITVRDHETQVNSASRFGGRFIGHRSMHLKSFARFPAPRRRSFHFDTEMN
jgi:hypothetical protein